MLFLGCYFQEIEADTFLRKLFVPGFEIGIIAALPLWTTNHGRSTFLRHVPARACRWRICLDSGRDVIGDANWFLRVVFETLGHRISEIVVPKFVFVTMHPPFVNVAAV